MSRDIWFFSDHHFGQSSILKFTDKDGNLVRPGFADVAEMDNYMIEMWNASIKPGDIVYHLGDIAFDKQKFTDSILNQLQGRIRLVVGNHDDIKLMSSLPKIQKILESRRFDDHMFIASHRPLHPHNLWNHRKMRPLINLVGHIHSNDPPPDQYINVCVERTGYKPIHIDDIAQQAHIMIQNLEEAYNEQIT